MGRVKMYKLENTSLNLSAILQSYNVGATPDICLITREGHPVFTNKVLLAMNSKMMTDVMVDNLKEDVIRISVPISSNILINLIGILSHGVLISDVKFDLRNILSAAAILGISLDLQTRAESRPVDQTIKTKRNNINIIENDPLPEQFADDEIEEIGDELTDALGYLKHEFEEIKGVPFEENEEHIESDFAFDMRESNHETSKKLDKTAALNQVRPNSNVKNVTKVFHNIPTFYGIL